MNERIKELADEAGFMDSWFSESGDDCERELKKFAELIVQECIDIIAPYTVRMSRPGEEYLHPILEIRKHFGVAE